MNEKKYNEDGWKKTVQDLLCINYYITILFINYYIQYIIQKLYVW